MANLEDVTIKIRNYKSFGGEEQGYEGIRPVNIIVGRNNTGKSTLLDLVQYATEPTDLSHLGHKGQKQPQVLVTVKLDSDEISRIFPKNTDPEKHIRRKMRYGADDNIQNCQEKIHPFIEKCVKNRTCDRGIGEGLGLTT